MYQLDRLAVVATGMLWEDQNCYAHLGLNDWRKLGKQKELGQVDALFIQTQQSVCFFSLEACKHQTKLQHIVCFLRCFVSSESQAVAKWDLWNSAPHPGTSGEYSCSSSALLLLFFFKKKNPIPCYSLLDFFPLLFFANEKERLDLTPFTLVPREYLLVLLLKYCHVASPLYSETYSFSSFC